MHCHYDSLFVGVPFVCTWYVCIACAAKQNPAGAASAASSQAASNRKFKVVVCDPMHPFDKVVKDIYTKKHNST